MIVMDMEKRLIETIERAEKLLSTRSKLRPESQDKIQVNREVSEETLIRLFNIIDPVV